MQGKVYLYKSAKNIFYKILKNFFIHKTAYIVKSVYFSTTSAKNVENSEK